ncbi:hypothetical protein [Pararhizobium sp. DWP3-4]|uniref:hypothetical protein n=1 Tax=Pararhizobium sp. DWP3-4 TaxID=2804565 RepID=UPI003CF0B411
MEASFRFPACERSRAMSISQFTETKIPDGKNASSVEAVVGEHSRLIALSGQRRRALGEYRFESLGDQPP